VRVHADRFEERSVLHGAPTFDVDAVVDDAHPGRIDLRVAAEDVGPHAGADRDHSGGVLVRELLDAAGDGIAAAELLGLPRTQRFEAVRGEDVRDSVQLGGEMPGEVRVPGVAVDDVGLLDRGDDLEVGAEGLQRAVRGGEFGGSTVGGRARLVARLAERPDTHLDALTKGRDQLGDVHSRTAVDLGRILLRDHFNSHV
jgi:hypothetical protein